MTRWTGTERLRAREAGRGTKEQTKESRGREEWQAKGNQEEAQGAEDLDQGQD